jgi:hypothetical protein
MLLVTSHKFFCYSFKSAIMAKATVEVISALRHTADKLEKSDRYQWGHMGLCNCGFLAQEVSHLSKSQIHFRAMEHSGDWSEQLKDYCPTSGLLMDDLISTMVNFGFDTEDLQHLERLSDNRILREFPLEIRNNIVYNSKEDVIKYLQTWSDLLERQLMDQIELPALPADLQISSTVS